MEQCDGPDKVHHVPMAQSLTTLKLRGVHETDDCHLSMLLQQLTGIVDLCIGNVPSAGTVELGFLAYMTSLQSLVLDLHMSGIADVDLEPHAVWARHSDKLRPSMFLAGVH
jgi:hypothetical protein